MRFGPVLIERNADETWSKRKHWIALFCFYYTDIDKLHIIANLQRYLDIFSCYVCVCYCL